MILIQNKVLPYILIITKLDKDALPLKETIDWMPKWQSASVPVHTLHYDKWTSGSLYPLCSHGGELARSRESCQQVRSRHTHRCTHTWDGGLDSVWHTYTTTGISLVQMGTQVGIGQHRRESGMVGGYARFVSSLLLRVCIPQFFR